MKYVPTLVILSLALGLGYLVGKQNGVPASKEVVTEIRSGRESRAAQRGPRIDPFGGPSFSLNSMDEIRDLFCKQSYSVASARLTLSSQSLKAEDIPALMEMVQKDTQENPNDYKGRMALIDSLFERWAVVDPTASVEFVKNCKSRSFQSQAASN